MQNQWWERTDPAVNDSPLRLVKEQTFGPGEMFSFHPDTIHSVKNINGDSVSVSIHVYGWHLAAKTEFWVYPGASLAGAAPRRCAPRPVHRVHPRTPTPTAAEGDPSRTLDAYQPEKRLQHNVRAADSAAAPVTAPTGTVTAGAT